VEFALLDLCDQPTASELLELQRRAYRVEAELIGSFAIPALHETLAELQRCGETFLGRSWTVPSPARSPGESSATRSTFIG
jgi:hypothetical protein